MDLKKQIFQLLLFLIVPLVSFSQPEIDLHILKKDYKEAMSKIEAQLEIEPTLELYLKKSMVLKQQQLYRKSIDCLNMATQLEPGNKRVKSELADVLTILGNYREASGYYENLLQLDSTQLHVAAKLGRVYINRKDYKKAFGLFDFIYDHDSSHVYWNKQYAYCAHRVGKSILAASLYETVIRDNPGDHGSYINLIHSYNPRKEGDKLLAAIELGLKQFPGDTDLTLERANYYFRIKLYEKASLEFESYFTNGGITNYELRLNYGISVYFSQAPEKALDVFSALYAEVPNDPIVIYYISLCQKKLKNFEEAEKMMVWAIEGSIPDYVSEMYHHLGQIYGQQRKFDESIEALSKAYELNPGKHEVLFEIATTYEEFNSNKTLALNYYRIYLKEVGVDGENINYALKRIDRLKEDLFFEQ